MPKVKKTTYAYKIASIVKEFPDEFMDSSGNSLTMDDEFMDSSGNFLTIKEFPDISINLSENLKRIWNLWKVIWNL